MRSSGLSNLLEVGRHRRGHHRRSPRRREKEAGDGSRRSYGRGLNLTHAQYVFLAKRGLNMYVQYSRTITSHFRIRQIFSR